MSETLLILNTLPADLIDLLGSTYPLAYLKDQPPGPVTGFRVGVTNSMAGADAALMDRLPGVKLIAHQGVGLDKTDLAAARSRGIAITNTPDVLTEDTADFAIGLLYGIARKVAEGDRFVRSGDWAVKGRMAPATRLWGKTCGIFGLGAIGSAAARRAEGLGMTVIWSGPRPKPGVTWDYIPDLLTLAERSDFLILTAPGGAATQKIVNAAVLAKLGAKGILINIARGSVVDEAALLDALEQKTIRGAGLDVFATEPNLDPRFLPLDNVVLAPHYASQTEETRAAMIALVKSNVDRHLAGQPYTDAAAG